MNLEGRVVAVTGAASGIGAALAEEAAARHAAAVAVIDLDADGARATAERIAGRGVKAAAFACDIADIDEVERVATEVTETLGVPGLVCANAGVNPDATPLLDAEPGSLGWALSVNVVGTWATLRAFGRRMAAAQDPGWLLVTASEHAIGVPFAGNGFYTVSKHAVLGLSDVLRRELPEHIGISVVVPGLVATGLWNSGSLRPQELGGPTPSQDLPRALLARGVEPAAVAALALDGVEAERFLVATHPHVKRYADARKTDLAEAFAALEAAGVPDTSYDVMEMAQELVAEAPGAPGEQ
ncbi:SDR family NAD(P)-dependent oxidoreductase [Streptomyces sp. DT195]|uniref:SDR family NAD(P)-dependent oxidoreductase n=1 Tax=Streptomyces sp. DT195 TaxID=3393419 RepID=UPI003CF4A86D